MRLPLLLAQISRFSLVGVAATLTYLIVGNLVIWADLMAPAWASVLAYLAGMVVSFKGQSRFTFRLQNHRPEHLARFAILSALGLGLSFGLVQLAESQGLAPVFATFGTAIAVPVISYVVMRLWVFGHDGQG